MRKITDDEIRFFDENGYVICRGVLAEDELEHCQSETQRLINEIDAGGVADSWCSKGPEGIPYYLNYLHANANSFSLRLLGNPFIGDLLTRMVGPDFIPCYESFVFKLPENGSSVPWHRDDWTIDGDERVFNIDTYLDVSDPGNGGVWVVPGSHRWSKEQAEEAIAHGQREFDIPGAVPAEMQPGDVLLHHVKVLHGSKANESDRLRRVIYFDNRSVSWNEKYRWFDPEVLRLRCEMYQFALYQRRITPYESDTETFDYRVPEGLPAWKQGDPVDMYAERVPWKE